MANIANNTTYIRGEKEHIEKVIQELDKISYCTDIYFEDDYEDECEVIFGSRWSEPMERLIDLSKEYSVEIDGYTRECGCGYYSEWKVVNGLQQKYHYGNLENDIEECPECGSEDIIPNGLESGYNDTTLYHILNCDDCGKEVYIEYDIERIEGENKMKISKNKNND